MKKIKIITGICWAFTGLILILILFPALNGWSASVAKLPFMKINPRYTGGEVVASYSEKNCKLDIHRPVFDGLFKDRHTGFVQIDWRGDLPDMIADTLDYNNDGIKDFVIHINRKKAETELTIINHSLTKLMESTPTSYGWSVRVGLVK